MATAASALNQEGAFSTFNPYAAPPLNIGERVVWLGNDEPEHGTVRWMGILLDISKEWTAGVEMDNPVGGMDGHWGGKKLFNCKPQHGMVIALHGLIKEEHFGDIFELVSPPPLEVVLTNDAVDSGLTNGHRTDDASTDEKQEVRVSENEGDKYIEKFLAAQSTPRTGASSFDRRVYARMFAECEVEKWYEVLNYPQEGACGSLDVGFDKARKKKKDSLFSEPKGATLGQNGEYAESKKKERGGIFRFFRWLRRSRSSKALDGSAKRTRSAMRASELHRGKTRSLESVTSLSQSFHYIPVGVRCSEDGAEGAQSKECVYEDLEPGLQPAPSPIVAKLKCSSMSRVNCVELEKHQRGAVYEDRRPRSVRSACSPSLGNSSLSRKKRRAPLPPTSGTPAGRRSAISPRSHWTRVLPGASVETAGSTSRLSNGDVALTHLGDLNRKIASSTGAIYKDPSKINPKADPKPPEFTSASSHKRSASLTTSEVPKVPSSPQRVGSHIKNKRKAPPPPKPAPNEPQIRTSKGIQTEPNKDVAIAQPTSQDAVMHRGESSVGNDTETRDKETPLHVCEDSLLVTKEPLQAITEPLQATTEPFQATEESLQDSKELLQATKAPLQATAEPLQATKEPLKATKQLHDTKDSVQIIKEPGQVAEEPMQAAGGKSNILGEADAAAELAKDDEDTPPELPKKQKCGKLHRQVEATINPLSTVGSPTVEKAENVVGSAGSTAGLAGTCTEFAIENLQTENSLACRGDAVNRNAVALSSTTEDEDAGAVANEAAQPPRKLERKSSKVSSSSSSSPVILKLKELRIIEDESHPKAETQMNIQALQELVETLVDQYCGNKSGDPIAAGNTTSKADDASAEDSEVTSSPQQDDFTEVPPRRYESAARRSMSVGSNASSGWMLEEKISNLDAENTLSTAYSTTNSSATTSASEPGEDLENDDQFAGRLLERWQVRMREQMINMDFNLPEKQRRSKKVEVSPLRSQSVSEEENNGGIYEPIGNFMRRTNNAESTSAAFEEPHSVNASWQRDGWSSARGSEERSLQRTGSSFGRRGSKRNSGFQSTFNGTENPDESEQRDPFLFWRDLCARKYVDGGNDQPPASEKLIRRLSVNGQRQPFKKDDKGPESIEDKGHAAAPVARDHPNDASLKRASSFQSGKQAQFQIYENVFTATPHRMVVVDGISTPNQYENCNPYWAAAGPMMPYGPPMQRRYAAPPYQALTVLPFMAPPMPHIYADPRFHPGGFLTPAFGGYVFPSPEMMAPLAGQNSLGTSRQAGKCGAGKTPTDRKSDSPLQEPSARESEAGCSLSRNAPSAAAEARKASSSVDTTDRDSTDEGSLEGKKKRGAIPKVGAGKTLQNPHNTIPQAGSGKILQSAVPKAGTGKVQQSDESKAGSGCTKQNVVPKDGSGNAQQNAVLKAGSNKTQPNPVPKVGSDKAQQNADHEAGSSSMPPKAETQAELGQNPQQQSAVLKSRGKSRSLERHSYANVPPSPPPRGSSSNRSSRLAANCDWLKEKSKSVEAKIQAARGEDDRKGTDKTGPQSVVQTRSQSAVQARPQSANPKSQAKSAVEVPVPKSRKTDSGTNRDPIVAKEKPPAHPAKSRDPSPGRAPNSAFDAKTPDMNSSVVIGGVRVPTPLNLWPLEYELIAPELRRLKARMEGKRLPEDAESDGCDTGDMDKLAVDRLLKQLEIAIGSGKLDEAATLARDLAQLKIQCLVVRNRGLTGEGSSQPIILNMFVEDKVSHHGPIPIRVLPSITVGELKTKIFQEFEFPTVIQRWILGKQLASDDKMTISSFGVSSDGCPVFLYLLSLEDLRIKAKDLVWDDNISPKATGAKAKVARARKPAPRKAEQPVVQERRPETPPVTEGSSEAGSTRLLGWSCKVCTLVNIPTRPGCAMCGSERPADYVVPEQYKLRESELERMECEKEQERAMKEAEELQRLQNWEHYLQLENQDVIYNEIAFECSICFAEAPPGQGVKLRDCLHSFCCDCLRRVVTHSEAATVICPFRDDDYSCDSALQEREIRALVPPEVFERYLQRSMKTAESQAPNSFHCKTPDCQGWCLIEDNANEFFCPVCSHLNCITCRAIHQELNCKQYQDKLMALARTDDEAKKTKDAIDVMLRRGEAMNCPNCQVIIMKKWGCDWLCCSVCKTEICWVTKGPRWGPNGRGDLSAGCKCGTNGVRCHPNCTYCH